MLIRVVVIAAIIYLIYRVSKWLMRALPKPDSTVKTPPLIEKEDLVEDPNCRTYLPKSSALKDSVGGRTAFFCSVKCRDEYRNRG